MAAAAADLGAEDFSVGAAQRTRWVFVGPSTELDLGAVAVASDQLALAAADSVAVAAGPNTTCSSRLRTNPPRRNIALI